MGSIILNHCTAGICLLKYYDQTMLEKVIINDRGFVFTHRVHVIHSICV